MDLSDITLTPLDGGFSGETFLAQAAGERSVVRIYANRGAQRGPDAPEVDAAVLRLVRGLIPVPEVLEVRRTDELTSSPGLLITSHLCGNRLDLELRQAGPELRSHIGAQLGAILARLAQMPMLRSGMFCDGGLSIEAFGFPAEDLTDWVQSHRAGTVLTQWSETDYSGLLEVASQAQHLLDGVDRACLVHSDFNPKNVLVDPSSGQVTAVLDWEFAHAGGPFTDLGNLLRFERDATFVDAVLATYTSGLTPIGNSGETRDRRDLLAMARAADLWALVELASRRDDNPVAGRAHAQLQTIARSGDLHATVA